MMISSPDFSGLNYGVCFSLCYMVTTGQLGSLQQDIVLQHPHRESGPHWGSAGHGGKGKEGLGEPEGLCVRVCLCAFVHMCVCLQSA